MYENYRSEDFRKETPDEYFDRIINYDSKHSENYHKTNWIREKLKEEWEPNNILDIGSGGGVLLHTLGEIYKNASLFGVEPTPNFADLASRRTRAEIKNDYFKGKPFKNKVFELITCCQVLEHVEDLQEFLLDISNSLAIGGYVYIEVPDISDFNELPLDHSRFSEPSHLWYFSSEFLTKYFESYGFQKQVDTVKKTVRNRNNLMILMKKISE
ncbi:class I SAM-dependent methyltransferase [Prochlorococcus marinus]|uniref:class I SAM-dependent methyltransferase n=1 Tax=Prochlorococcus marinus TaxID=1219 RepID=UPI0022B2EA81|nr:class I SAM-dependent methyltransferase [Prochlorococcus marinus]